MYAVIGSPSHRRTVPRNSLASRLWDSYVILRGRPQHQSLTRNVRSAAGIRGNLVRWRDRRIEQHLHMVRTIARQVAHMLPPRVPLDDLISAGHVGLCTAAERYSPERGEFVRYAWFVIRGAIIDSCKRRRYREELHESVEGMRERLGYMPGALVRDPGPSPEVLAEREQAVQAVRLLISELPREEAELMRAVMGGASVSAAARSLGRSPAWGRAKLAEARDRVGAGMMLR